MAIAFDSSSYPATSNTKTWSHTTTGSDRLLIVIVASMSTVTRPSVTYGGVSMTRIDDSTYLNITGYYLINPTVGANNITISTSLTVFNAVASSYTGCSQITQPDSFGYTYSSGTPVIASTTVAQNGCWLVGYGYIQYTGNIPTLDSNSLTTRASRGYNSSQNIMFIADSNGIVSTGSNSTTVGFYASTAYSLVFSIASSVPPDSGGAFFAFF